MKSKVAAKAMRAVPLLPNSLVLFGYNRLKKSISAKRIEEHYQNNTDKLKAFIEPDVFIEKQHTADWDSVMYGVNIFNKNSVPASYNICGVIGVFNALIALGEHVDAVSMARLIRIFEGKGVALGGLLGTTPRAIASFFKNRGYKVTKYTSTDASKIDAFGKEHDTFIVIVMNNRKTLEDYMHIVNISVDDEGMRRTFHVHNGSEGKAVSCYTLSRAITGINKRGSAIQNKALLILGIDKDPTINDKK